MSLIESNETQERFLIRTEEFDSLMYQLHENCWIKNISKYIQILKEWNECIGFEDIEEEPSIILDIQDTIQAMELAKGGNEMEYRTLSQSDLKQLIAFFTRNKNTILTIKIDSLTS